VSRLAAAFAVLLAFAACERPAEPAAEPAKKEAAAPEPSTKLENGNLLNLVFGATVLDRSNELSFESGAAYAFDGTPWTTWRSAPGGRLWTTVSLATTTRLRRFGLTVPASKKEAPQGLLVEASMDGAAWRKALETDVRHDTHEPQFFDVQPVVDARFLRITLVEPTDYYTVAASLQLIGEEVAPYVQSSLEGCWEINHEPARFERRGARIFGTIGTSSGDDMLIDGGTDGRVHRLMWREQMNWGYAAVSVSSDGNHLSGVRWHEEVNPKNAGDAWMGKRVPCASGAAIDGDVIVDRLIARAAFWRIYGVRFDREDRILEDESDDALDLAEKLIRTHPNHRFRIVARELREPAEPRIQARCRAKLDAMREALRAREADLSRVTFESAGAWRHPLSVDFTGQRVMDSSVELQVVPPQ